MRAKHRAAMLLAVLLGGCTYNGPIVPPQVTLEVGGDEFPMNPTPQGPPPPPQGASLTAPPPNMAGGPAPYPPPLPAPVAYLGPPQSGQYFGSGRVTNDLLGECQSTIRISNWTVNGSSVRFGAFEGTIRPDGSLSMQARQTYIDGHFNGSVFQGRVWRGLGGGCQYLITVQPVV